MFWTIVLIQLIVYTTVGSERDAVTDSCCLCSEDDAELCEVAVDNSGGGRCLCKIQDGQHIVDCENRNLVRVPSNLPNCTNILNLSNNNITAINMSTIAELQQLQNIILTNNPLHCDCQLQWLTMFAHKQRLEVTDAVCKSPSEFKDEAVIDLKGRFNCTDMFWYDEQLFLIYAFEKLSWIDAYMKCVGDIHGKLGLEGRLAIIQSEDVLHGLRGHIKQHEALNQATGFWLGCHDFLSEGVFRWVDGTSVQRSFWPSGEPNDADCHDGRSDAGEGQDCCALRKNSAFRLDDQCCSARKPFICSVGNATVPLYCGEESIFNNKGIFYWPRSGKGQVTKRNCPYGPKDVHVERICFRDMVTWSIADTSQCLPENKANKTDRLFNLATTDILPGHAKIVSETLKAITTQAKLLEESDVSLSVDVIDNILRSHEKEISVDVGYNLLRTVDNLLNVDDDVMVKSHNGESSATRLLQTVERLSLLLTIANESVTIATPSIVLTVAELNLATFDGLSFSLSSTGQTQFSRKTESTEHTKAEVQLPVWLFENLQQQELARVERVQFHAYTSNKLFKTIDDSTPAGFSPVISASIGNLTISNLKKPVKIAIAHESKYNESNNLNISCVFWDFSLNNGRGAWSSEGCTVSRDTADDENITTCECDHLTNFALLVDIYGDGQEIDPANQRALSIISYIGCTLSLLGLALTLVSLIAFRKRKDRASKITLNLCFALFMALLLFLIGSFAMDFAPIIPELCAAVAVFLHFFLLAALLWMALEAVNMYLMLVKIFETYIRHFMVKCCIIGWGVPLVVVVITLAVDVDNYGYYNTICWLSRYSFYGAFLAPLCLVLVFNSIIYCLVIYQICGLRSRATTGNEGFSVKEQLRAALGLMVLLGLTWVFAIFAVGEASLLFNYLFAIFNSLQGLFIVVFHCALKKEIQKGWKNTFCGEKGPEYRSTETRSSANTSGNTKDQTSQTTDTNVNLDSLADSNARPADIRTDADTKENMDCESTHT